jgi:hypothetical protein
VQAPRIAVATAFVLLLGAIWSASAPATSGWENCGSKRGGFPVAGAPGLTGAVFVKARNVGCENALGFGHSLFFGQECVYCDDPASYSPGERFRFRGFNCEAYRGQPQRFHCVRGERVINVRTDIDQI